MDQLEHSRIPPWRYGDGGVPGPKIAPYEDKSASIFDLKSPDEETELESILLSRTFLRPRLRGLQTNGNTL